MKNPAKKPTADGLLKAKLAAAYGPRKFRITVQGDIFVFKTEPQPSRKQGWSALGNIKNADVRRKVAGL